MDDRLTRQTILDIWSISKTFGIIFERILAFKYLFLFIFGLIYWRQLHEKKTRIREELSNAIYAGQQGDSGGYWEYEIERLETEEHIPAATYQGLRFGMWLNFQLHPWENLPEDD